MTIKLTYYSVEVTQEQVDFDDNVVVKIDLMDRRIVGINLTMTITRTYTTI